MKVTFSFPSSLQEPAGARELIVEAETSKGVLDAFWTGHPRAARAVMRADNELQPFVHAFCNGQHFELHQPLKDGDRLDFIAALAGG